MALVFCLGLSLCSLSVFAADIQLIQTAEGTGDRLTPKDGLSWGSDFSFDTVISVDATSKRQEVFGFGGAFTDASAYNFALMSEDLQEQVLEAYFGSSGIGYSFGRIPINSCDFTRFTYSFDEVVNDYNLDNFDVNVTQDQEVMIPFILRAQGKSVRPIKFYGSPWSPTSWMKIAHPGQYGTGMNGSAYPLGLIQDPTIFSSWALYFSKWIKSYQNYGIHLWGITVQNEPQALQPFESCLYTAQAEADFIKYYLGPQLRKDFPSLKIMGWDHNKYPANINTSNGPTDRILTDWVKTLYKDPDTAQYVDGVAFHWYQIFEGYNFEFDLLNQSYYLSPPGKFLLNTEACWCGTPSQNWTHGEWYGIDIIGDLSNWAAGWVDWNLILNDTGGPNHIPGHICEAPFIYNISAKTLSILPQYYYMGQISRYLTPESTIVLTSITDPTSTDPTVALTGVAGITPEGQTVLIVINPSGSDRGFKLVDVKTSRVAKASIPQHSIQTYLYF